MKKSILILFIPVLAVLTGCGDFMNLKNDEKLSGNDFWTDAGKADVEAFTASIYNSFRLATMKNTGFLTVTGDFRLAPIVPYSTSNSYITQWAQNDVNGVMNNGNAGNWTKKPLSSWKTFYQVIQSANILVEEIGRADISELEKTAYRQEAVFMRCLTYFFLVRAFGNVPYYTNAYHSEALGRTDLVTVLTLCLAELQGILDEDPDAQSMPWTFPDASKRGVRAMRGGVLALMMHINMWLVRFDNANAETWYRNVAALGDQLVNHNQGAYALVDRSMYPLVFRGGSPEGLFEICQNINYSGETFEVNAVFSNHVVYKNINKTALTFYYDLDFLQKIFPYETEDKRKELWFDDNLYSMNGSMKEVLKFLNVDSYEEGKLTSNAGNQIVFRYAGALLLYAEALSELGGAENEETARRLLKMVRDRVQAPTDSNLTGEPLKDAIYWERVRELIGEGHYFYDLVRTGKIYSRDYAPNAISRTHFNAGAWTLPIHEDAFANNPRMTHNSFWL